jgi:hypothetical protein
VPTRTGYGCFVVRYCKTQVRENAVSPAKKGESRGYTLLLLIKAA